MPINFSGRVLFANNVPARDVRVRIFDQDDPGKVDDDLTTNEGRTDASGNFTVAYDPSRYLDFKTQTITAPRNIPWDWTLVTHTIQVPDLTDLYLPYLRFRYTVNGQSRQVTAPLVPFQNEFRLPENAPSVFKPSQHGFLFGNSWPGYPLPISVPGVPGLPSVSGAYGLCGGMSAAAYDFLLAGRAIPQTSSVPAQGSPLQQYIYRRQVDTFGVLGAYIAKFAQWMVIPDDTIYGTQKRTHDEFASIRAKLDDQNAVVLGQVNVKSANVTDLWSNHQVLAYGYQTVSPTAFDIKIYDPNFPSDDTVRIRAERVPVGIRVSNFFPRRIDMVFGLRCEQLRGKQESGKTIHGFFDMNYTPVVPPTGLS